MTQENTTEPGGEASLPEASFQTLVTGLTTQVLMNLGVFANPVTGEATRDLAHAKYTIDLLEVIKEKTRGNLTEQESGLLDMSLYELRMKFVQASGAA